MASNGWGFNAIANGSPQIKGAKKSALQWVMGSNRSSWLAWGWKQRGRLEAKALEALFIGLMAPAQQLLEMHHTSSVGFTETHDCGTALANRWSSAVDGPHDHVDRAEDRHDVGHLHTL